MKVILDTKQIEQILGDLTNSIISDTPPDLDIAVIGIRSRGRSWPRGCRADYHGSLAKIFRVGLLI
jgi:pyrimidine operon attenuation protein/uracil phosphoribosyltransferase